MRETRAVLDANVHVSAVLQPSGTPGQIIECFLRDAAFELVLSPSIVDEVLRAMSYPKVQKFLRDDVDPEAWFENVVVLGDLVAGELDVSGVCDDADDDKYVAAALEGRASFVVSGDRRFLALKEHQGIHILTPREFLGLLPD